MLFGVSKFSGFRGGVVMPFVSLQNMVSQTGHSCFYAEVRFMWTHGMLETQHWVLGFACFCGFGVICVLGRGRDDIRLSSTHGMQQTRHSWLAHAFLNSACKHFSFLPRACARWSCRAVGYVRVLGCRGFGYDLDRFLPHHLLPVKQQL